MHSVHITRILAVERPSDGSQVLNQDLHVLLYRPPDTEAVLAQYEALCGVIEGWTQCFAEVQESYPFCCLGCTRPISGT